MAKQKCNRWHDLICDVMWCDMMWRDVMWHDVSWHDVMGYVIWWDETWYMIWWNMIWDDKIWWFDVIWYDMIYMIWWDMIWYTGCPKINITFLKFCSLKVKLPLQHQNHNLLEEACRILSIPNMYQLVTSWDSKMVWKFTGVDTLYHSLLESLSIPGRSHSGVHKLECSCTQHSDMHLSHFTTHWTLLKP